MNTNTNCGINCPKLKHLLLLSLLADVLTLSKLEYVKLVGNLFKYKSATAALPLFIVLNQWQIPNWASVYSNTNIDTKSNTTINTNTNMDTNTNTNGHQMPPFLLSFINDRLPIEDLFTLIQIWIQIQAKCKYWYNYKYKYRYKHKWAPAAVLFIVLNQWQAPNWGSVYLNTDTYKYNRNANTNTNTIEMLIQIQIKIQIGTRCSCRLVYCP